MVEVKAEEKMIEKTSATIDYLTGDLNRRGMYEYFDELPEDQDISFMFLDIDNFKSVNDTYGHAMGDKLLKEVSKTIRERISNSLLVRIGGDEFVVLPMQGLPERAVVGMAESILNSVDEIDISAEIRSIITFSIGIVMNQKKSMGLDAILPKCDAAMYEAKRRGKNGYVVYSTIEDLFEFKQMIEREKNSALHDGKFGITYMPIMNIASTTLVAAEARIVWNRGKTLVWQEDMFRDILEENGFIVELERYIFEGICEMLKDGNSSDLGKIPILFTLSGTNISRVNVVDELLETVKANGLNPDQFIIQLDNVSERVDIRRVVHFFENLKSAGFRTSIKLFGSGGVSVVTIKNLLLDYVWIGKDVIGSLVTDRREGLFVKNILALVSDLNFEAIVSGMDDSMQLRYLNSYRCTLGSGQIFSRPLDKEEYVQFVIKNFSDNRKVLRFDFDRSLKDTTGTIEARYFGTQEMVFAYDNALQKDVLQFPGGPSMNGVVEFDTDIVGAESYSIIIKFRTDEFNDWTSLFYIMYENGFMSYMPFAWNGLCIYRMKDDLEENGWFDVVGNKIDNGWHTAILTFNHKSSVIMLYVDGRMMGLKDNVFHPAETRRVVLGGDIYAKSFIGAVDYIEFYNYILSQRDVEKMFSKKR